MQIGILQPNYYSKKAVFLEIKTNFSFNYYITHKIKKKFTVLFNHLKLLTSVSHIQ